MRGVEALPFQLSKTTTDAAYEYDTYASITMGLHRT